MSAPLDLSAPTIKATLDQMLDEGYAAAAAPLLRAIDADLTNSGFSNALAQLDQEAGRLERLGERLSEDNPALRVVWDELDQALRSEAAILSGIGDELMLSGIEAAGYSVRATALEGLTESDLRGIGAVWNTPNPQVVAAAVNYVASDAWREMIRTYAPETADVIMARTLLAVLEGRSPRDIAQTLRSGAESLIRFRAENMAITLQLTAYRDAGVMHRMANADILVKQIRIETLDDRICLACLSEHGAEYPIDARIDEHHRGRGDSISVVKGFNREVESGEDWLKRVIASNPDRARELMGAANYAAYLAGQVRLTDFVGKRDDPIFGAQIYELSLKGVLGDQARNYYQ